MFKTASMRTSKSKDLSEDLTDETILQFALAEFSSAVEMLHAAKLVNNSKLAFGFVNHALDEYKHTNFFLHLLSKSNSSYIRFDPRQTISGNFIRPDAFLFERLKLIEFAAFIAVNEENALKIFTSIRRSVQKKDPESSRDLGLIIEEERAHLRSIEHDDDQQNTGTSYNLFETLLADEARHVAFSSKFLDKSNLKFRVTLAKRKSKLGNKIRHFWASQQKFHGFVDRLISNLTIFLLRPLRNTLAFPPSRDNDLFSEASSRNML